MGSIQFSFKHILGGFNGVDVLANQGVLRVCRKCIIFSGVLLVLGFLYLLHCWECICVTYEIHVQFHEGRVLGLLTMFIEL